MAPERAAAVVETFPAAVIGLARQEGLAAELGGREARFLAWRAPQALIVGPRDAALPGFAVAARCLAAIGWPVVVRRSGGSACPVSPGTLQLSVARPVEPEMTVDRAYGELAAAIVVALDATGIHAAIAPRTDTFCPGRYDLAVDERKIVGLSQHWRMAGGHFVVTTAAVLIVAEDPLRLAMVVNLFYRTAGSASRCSPAAIGTLGTTADPTGDLIAARLRDLLFGQPAAHPVAAQPL